MATRTVHLKLTEREAETLHTALLHTRREYLGLRERDLLHKLIKGLQEFDCTRVIRQVPVQCL